MKGNLRNYIAKDWKEKTKKYKTVKNDEEEKEGEKIKHDNNRLPRTTGSVDE